MTVLFVGTSHATAPVATIERVAFSADDAAATLARITPDDMLPTLPLRELVVLSTSHRVELYAVPADNLTRPSVAIDALVRLLADRGMDLSAADSQVRRLIGTDASRHLLRVAAGLESMVLGECEVLDQVAGALALAVRVGAAGPMLTPLFEAAVRTGRRAMSETAIAAAPATASSIAAELAEEIADDLRGRRALFVGAGNVAGLTAKAVRASGFWDMTVVAAPGGDSTALAAELAATCVAPDATVRAIAESDLVFTFGTAPAPIDAATVRRAMRGRMARPLAFIDLSAGEALDPAVGDLSGVRVVGPAELRERIDLAIAVRHREVPLVETLVEEEVRALQARADSNSLSGVVAALRARAEEIRQRELAHALAAVPNADPVVRAQLEWLSVSLVNKLLDEPTRRLRAESVHGHANPYADATRELFGLMSDMADRPIA